MSALTAGLYLASQQIHDTVISGRFLVAAIIVGALAGGVGAIGHSGDGDPPEMNALPLDGDTDTRLVEAARRGSDVAFERIVARHQQAVRAFLRRLGGDAADADDLAQDTFVAAWRELDRFRGGSSLRSWLCGIAYRKRLGQRRSQRRAGERDTRRSPSPRSAGGGGGDAGDRLDLARAMAELPIDQRAAVSLCLAADFSHAEAAAALNLPLGTVKSHVTRGRAKLLEVLTREVGPNE